MTTATWIWIGNRPRLDNTSSTNIRQDQANVANGWTASGRDELKVVDATGPTAGNWNTTYQRGTTQFSYDRPTGGTTNNAQIVTFIGARFEIETEDEDGNPITVTRDGILKQANNGDVFIRPSSDSVDTWNDITVIYGITVRNPQPLSDGTPMAKVGFNPEIKDVVVPCFTAGTLIATDRGEIAVEDLNTGDRVWTRDLGFQPITWIGRRRLDATLLELWPNLRPIRIAAGALGQGLPLRDLVVSPQHRVLVRSAIAERMFGRREVLVAAKHLLGLTGIEVASDLSEVEYVHFMLGRHAVVRSNGAETESLFPGPQAMKSIPHAARSEIMTLFPELAEATTRLPEPARFLPKGSMARQMTARHVKNGRELVS